ncbi:xanthine dehydrogenase family protein molybdopterin-binding subunit [Granulibacter bethesdensis]|uniref:xanthine dehydrogenase family protein molybdopterin-binding subunit n=1 Tax=Granulibacter bethesdensis TaxID=364410 RepID=UPI00090B2611|nr:xanthine dehydrogenase family protein molybdopterin-binding subunit [Granulibacter bethesdensis]APH59121.1 Membrane-bound aldehyde dehydrogenase, large subunit [Granulibacter bethesdensis]
MNHTPLSRRGVLAGGAALVIGTWLPRSRHAKAEGATEQAEHSFAPNAFIRVAQDGGITLIMRDVEMGQGIWTGASMLLAEELEVGLDQISPQFAPPDDKLYASPLLQMQATGGSTSIRGDYKEFRMAAATARSVLVQAAAREWGVPPGECTVKRGVISHQASGRSAPYKDFVAVAVTLPVPKHVPLKDPKDWTLIGHSQRRLDTPPKVNGTAVYGIDVKLPGLKVATVETCPVLGGKLVSMDENAARAIPGVRDVLKLDYAVAVVGDHFWAAKQGVEALHIVWDEGPNAQVSQAEIVEGHKAASRTDGLTARKVGDPEGALSRAASRIEAVYQLPFLAHAPMEPINCTVHVRKDSAEVWCGTQVPARAQEEVVQVTGLPKEKVQVHNYMIGGGFGRRLESEYVRQAAAFGRQVSYPLKLIWTRETDIRHDRLRPYYYDTLSGGLDADGKVIAWTHKTTGASVLARWAPVAMPKTGIDPDLIECAETPYDIPNMRNSWVRHEPPGVVVAWWRGVGPAHNVFVVESFVDELAAAAKQDPLNFRRALLHKNPRALGVLNAAAEKAGWGTSLPPRHGRGIMVQNAFGSYLSVVCDAEVKPDGTVRLHRLVAAMDCGRAINPDSVRAQIEGGLVFGLTAALYGEITLEKGRVQQSNFNDYRMLRMNEVPPIDIVLIDSTEDPGGLGETGTAAAFPAIANAVFAATGKRIRRLPLGLGQLADA